MAALIGETTISTSSPGLVGRADYSWASNGTLTVTVYMRTNSSGGWANDPWQAQVKVNNDDGTLQTKDTKGKTSGTIGKDEYSASFSFSLAGWTSISVQVYWSSFNRKTGKWGSGTAYAPISPPSYNSISASSITQTSVYLSASINENGGSLTDGGWDVSTNGGASWSYYGGGPTGKTITGLSSNTTYWYRGYAANAAGGVNSGWQSFTTLKDPAPTGVSINPAPSRTSINLNRAWSNATYCHYNINDWGWIAEGSSYSNGVKCDGNNVTGLTPNTSYKCRVRFGNGTSDLTYSSEKTVITTHNAPSIGTRSVTHSRAATTVQSTYTTTVSYATTYDYTSYSSHKLEYGTSTSYGSTATSAGTGGSSKFTLSGLQPNKTYYYKITETDNGGNSTQTSTATGSFTTPGIAPSVSVSTTPSDYGCSFTNNTKFDTNASQKSFKIDYGKTTSYGSSTTSTSISGLEDDRTYYYRVTVVDNYDRSSTTTGSFTTTWHYSVKLIKSTGVTSNRVYIIKPDGTKIKVHKRNIKKI